MFRCRSLPLTTIILGGFSLLGMAVPGLAELLQLDGEAVGNGQGWRLWTGHLAHWTADHLFWDALVFLALGSYWERQDRRLYWIVLGVGLPAISVGLGLCCPEISTYRGLSGIDTGLFVWLLLTRLQRELRARQRASALLWTVLLAGLLGKLAYEAATGSCLFVETSPTTFRPLVESHLLGAAIGCLAFAKRISLSVPGSGVPQPSATVRTGNCIGAIHESR